MSLLEPHMGKNSLMHVLLAMMLQELRRELVKLMEHGVAHLSRAPSMIVVDSALQSLHTSSARQQHMERFATSIVLKVTKLTET